MRKLTNEEYLMRLKNKNINIKPLEEYKGYNTPIWHMCLYDECGHKWKTSPNSVLSQAPHCPVCYKRRLNKGLKYTRPDLYELLVDKRDGYKCTEFSSKKVYWECPNCHKKIKQQVCQVSMRGLFCKYCSDGVSYPMKFTMSVLRQLNVNFTTEVNFEWAKFHYHNHTRKARYDIVFDNYIIEVDGNFHKVPHSKSKMTIEDVIFIDSEKDRLAKENGYEMIRIDCSNSNSDYVKQSILNSKLNVLFDLNNIDWNKCDLYASSSLLVEICNLWNKEKNPSRQLIQDITGYSKSMVYKYLRKGYELGICSYNPYEEKKKNWADNKKSSDSVKVSVVCLNNGLYFDTLTKALEWCNAKSSTCIVKNCKGLVKYAHTDPNTKEKLQWAFYKDYINMTQEDIKNRLSVKYTNSSFTKVINIKTKEIFDSIKEAEIKYQYTKGTICRICIKNKNNKGIFLDDTILNNWMYYEDYLREKEAI